jgi:tetratricopeptide (TPR) repeat protein
MKVPLHLRRRASAEPAIALLVPGHRAEDVLHLCARLGCDPRPTVHLVADGFLLELPRPLTDALPGSVRLRRLAKNLLLPVDADLRPALLPDEAAALVSKRGLVFLPGGRVLEFAPERPLPLSALLTGPVRRGEWRPLPEAGKLADRITEFALETPPESPDAMLAAGAPDVATEEPRPPDASLPAKALGRAAYGLGKGLAWLGSKLALGPLTRAGASLVAGALSLAPRLSEALMGKQEASLRDLLRDFREGNVERALRRALPLGDTHRGSNAHQGSQLPLRNTSYSLFDILRGTGGGPGSVWFSSADTYRELENEYRKVAEAAARSGDYRRAAFIYGKLLGDYRQAAAVLARGGLHRDAALLYQHKLHDYPAAAREYEAAGDVDRALALYRKCGEHALAGDLLRRAGEEELAVAEYQVAAAKLAASGNGQYQAGELLLHRAGRVELALPYYEEGWKQRPTGSAIPCALRLAQLHPQRGGVEPLLALVGEAEDYLRPEGNDGPAVEFFNEVARLAEARMLAAVRDELRDRALLGLAGKMRQAAEGRSGAAAVATGMGAGTVWAPAVVSDAQFAVRREAVRRVASLIRPRAATTVIRARIPVVTAVCQASGNGEIAVGFQSGEVCLFRPRTGEIIELGREDHPVTSLAISTDAEAILVLSGAEGAVGYVASYTKSIGYRMAGLVPVQPSVDPWLCALGAGGPEGLACLFTGQEFHFLRLPGLVTEERWSLPGVWWNEPSAALLLSSLDGAARPYVVCLTPADIEVCQGDEGKEGDAGWERFGWLFKHPEGCTLQRLAFNWLRPEPRMLEVAGPVAGGGLGWAQVRLTPRRVCTVGSAMAALGEPCLTVGLIRPGRVAAVTRRCVYWYRCSNDGVQLTTTSPLPLTEAVACFPHHGGNELIVVGAHGTVARVAPLHPR